MQSSQVSLHENKKSICHEIMTDIKQLLTFECSFTNISNFDSAKDHTTFLLN